MTDISQIIDYPESEPVKITLKQILRIILLKPKTDVHLLLNQVKFKYLHLFPVLLSFLSGVNKSIILARFSSLSYVLFSILGQSVMSLIYTYITIFICSWVVYLISKAFQGFASIHMTYGLISYCTIPLIIGVLVSSVFMLFFFMTKMESMPYKQTVSIIRIGAILKYLFAFWSLIIVLIGNAYINRFSLVRSVAVVAGLLLLLVLYSSLRK